MFIHLPAPPHPPMPDSQHQAPFYGSQMRWPRIRPPKEPGTCSAYEGAFLGFPFFLLP